MPSCPISPSFGCLIGRLKMSITSKILKILRTLRNKKHNFQKCQASQWQVTDSQWLECPNFFICKTGVVCMHVCVHVCVYMCKPEVNFKHPCSVAFHLVFWDMVSHFYLKFTHSTRLASQEAPDIFLLHLPGAGIFNSCPCSSNTLLTWDIPSPRDDFYSTYFLEFWRGAHDQM